MEDVVKPPVRLWFKLPKANIPFDVFQPCTMFVSVNRRVVK